MTASTNKQLQELIDTLGMSMDPTSNITEWQEWEKFRQEVLSRSLEIARGIDPRELSRFGYQLSELMSYYKKLHDLAMDMQSVIGGMRV